MLSVFPAPAGINRIPSKFERERCVPRASGDKPPVRARGRISRVPRASGDKPDKPKLEKGIRVFPAPAGINRCYREKKMGRVPAPAGINRYTFLRRKGAGDVFPAPAGINRGLIRGWRYLNACSPRQRG
ncbi:hypothetical protein ACNKHR_19440 [Shigella flexneri]